MSLSSYVKLQESQMQKEVETFNLKASKETNLSVKGEIWKTRLIDFQDFQEKDRLLADKTSDLDRLVSGFANDFKAKLEAKVEATRRRLQLVVMLGGWDGNLFFWVRLNQEIKDLQTEIQGERQKREVHNCWIFFVFLFCTEGSVVQVLESDTRDHKATESLFSEFFRDLNVSLQLPTVPRNVYQARLVPIETRVSEAEQRTKASFKFCHQIF